MRPPAAADAPGMTSLPLRAGSAVARAAVRRRATLAALALVAAIVATVVVAAPAHAAPVAVLKLRDAGGLERFARAVSDPASPRYRGYLTVEQLRDRFGAPRRARARTAGWLRAHGLRATVAPSGTFVVARGSARELRAAFAPAGSAAAASAAISGAVPVPAALRDVVREAQLLGASSAAAGAAATRARARARARGPRRPRNIPEYDANDPYQGLSPETGSIFERTGTPSGCQAGTTKGFTPSQVHRAYGIDALHRRGLRGEGMHVAVIEVDGFEHADVRTFADCFGARMPQIRARTVGQRRNSTDGSETPLDLEVLIAAAPRLERIDVYTANPNAENFSSSLVQAMTLALTARGALPDAISLSLGECEAAFGLLDFGGPLTAVRALDDLFALSAAAGVSVLVSSGDNGSAGCTRTASTSIPLASFPATSPWVTAVGGTNLQLTDDNRIARQVVWNDTPGIVRIVRERGLTVAARDVAAAGGGGRSLLFDQPWYQQAPGLSGQPRVVPDIAALADPYPGYAYYCTTASCAGDDIRGWGSIGGTSAAAPLMAAATVLMSQEARRRGQPPLGFLNPLVYRLANSGRRTSLFSDVTIGTNDVTAAMPASSIADGLVLGVYPAVRGFDLASGWGSPKLAALNRAALTAAAG
jgi:subtilase family serine protease